MYPFLIKRNNVRQLSFADGKELTDVRRMELLRRAKWKVKGYTVERENPKK